VAIIGGLIASQLLTLLTTPVVYVLLDKVRRRPANEKYLSREATDPLLVPDPSPAPSPSGKGLG
jgi:multidrug efflux pump